MTAKKSTSGDSGELISAYLDGELTADERTQVEELLATNAEARKLLEELRSVSQTIRALPRRSLGPSLRRQVLDATIRPAAPPRAAGFRRGLAWASLAAAAALLLTITQRGNFYGDAGSDKSVAQVAPAEPIRERAPLSAGGSVADAHGSVGAVHGSVGGAGPTAEAAAPIDGTADIIENPSSPAPIAQEKNAPSDAEAENWALRAYGPGNADEMLNAEGAIVANGNAPPDGVADHEVSELRFGGKVDADGSHDDLAPDLMADAAEGDVDRLMRMAEPPTLAVRVVMDAEAREGGVLEKLFATHAIRQVDESSHADQGHPDQRHPDQRIEAFAVTAPQPSVERLLADLGRRMGECREIAVESASEAPPPSNGGSWQRFNVLKEGESLRLFAEIPSPLESENGAAPASPASEPHSESAFKDHFDEHPLDNGDPASAKSRSRSLDEIDAGHESEQNWGFAIRIPDTEARARFYGERRLESTRAGKSAEAPPAGLGCSGAAFLRLSLVVEWQSAEHRSSATSHPAAASPAPPPAESENSATPPP